MAAFLVILSCLLSASLGAPIAVYSVLWRTLLLSPSTLRLRTSFFGIGIDKAINLADVIDFGFGYPSHSHSGVLRLELRTAGPRTKWISLASGTTQEEVDAFLRDIRSHGFQLPH